MIQPSEPLGFRDERPSGPCLQTFFRNHEVIIQSLFGAGAGAGTARSGPLRILDIGGGVLEPLLIAALCELLQDAGRLDGYDITCLDLSAEVRDIHECLRSGRAYQNGGHEVVGADGRLSLPGLARVFSATHAEVNSWLVDPVALSGQLQRWVDLGVARYLGIPPDVGHSTERMQRFIAQGLEVPRRLLAGIRTVHGDIGAAEPPLPGPEWADVVVSNYAIQYPLWEGTGEQALRNVERCLAPDAVVQIGNAYSAQGELLTLIDRMGGRLAGLHVELVLRESFIVAQYADDDPDGPPRLVSRADLFAAAGRDRLPGVARDALKRFTHRHDGRVVPFGSPGELGELMSVHSGLQGGGQVVYHAWWNPDDRAGIGYLLPRDVLLAFGRNPLRPRGLFGSPPG